MMDSEHVFSGIAENHSRAIKTPYSQSKCLELTPMIKLKHADGTETIHYSILYSGVLEELKNVARVELNESEEKKRHGTQYLREALEREGISELEDFELIACLRKCKYNLKKAETQLLTYLKTRREIMDDLQKADIQKLEHALDHNVVGILPYRDEYGRVICFTTPNFNDFKLFDIEDVSLCLHLVLSFILSFPITSIAGVVYIGEAKLLVANTMYPILKTFQKHMGCILSFPARLAKIEVLNELLIVRWAVNIIKQFLTRKIADRISFHGSDVSSIRKAYHPDILPEEFGETMGPVNNTFFREELINFIKRAKKEKRIYSRNQ